MNDEIWWNIFSTSGNKTAHFKGFGAIISGFQWGSIDQGNSVKLSKTKVLWTWKGLVDLIRANCFHWEFIACDISYGMIYPSIYWQTKHRNPTRNQSCLMLDE
jgi:hypothetical protein